MVEKVQSCGAENDIGGLEWTERGRAPRGGMADRLNACMNPGFLLCPRAKSSGGRRAITISPTSPGPRPSAVVEALPIGVFNSSKEP